MKKNKGIRDGIDKSAIVKTAQENEAIRKMVETLTKEEMERILQQREYDTIEEGTPTYKIAVMCDTLRQNQRRLKGTISKRIWTISDVANTINRLQMQLDSGTVTEKLKDGVTMSQNELNVLINHNKWAKDGEFYALFPLLAELRALVGHKDVARNVIITQEKFDEYVDFIAAEVEMYGYNLFGELDG